MPVREYATFNGDPSQNAEFVIRVEHTQDALHFMAGWEVLHAWYGPHDTDIYSTELYDIYEQLDPYVKYDVTNGVNVSWEQKRNTKAKNLLFGDPAYGKKKMLFVVLRQMN